MHSPALDLPSLRVMTRGPPCFPKQEDAGHTCPYLQRLLVSWKTHAHLESSTGQHD